MKVYEDRNMHGVIRKYGLGRLGILSGQGVDHMGIDHESM